MANESTKWLYDKLKDKGYNVGKDVDEFDSLMRSNAESRKWAYETARKSGLNVGKDIDEFSSLVGGGAQAVAPVEDVKPESPAQPMKPQAWQPTPIQKAFMLDKVQGALNAKDRMQTTIEDSRRLARSMTQEGRDAQKAGEMTARMAGKYKKPLGLSPTVGGGDGSAATGPRSQQSPVVNGVKMVDGELKTEYMLPDGSLTTDFTEADRAEYNARSARLQHEFEKRMAQNGLDPSKQEDIEEQRKCDLLDESEKRVAIRLRENEANLRGVNERKAKRFDAVTDEAADGWHSEEGFWDNFTRIVGAAVNRGSQYAHPANRPEESLTADERDERLLTTEHNVLTEAKNLLETRQLKKSNGFMSGFFNVGNNWRNMKMGARHAAGDVDLYAGGVMSLQKATQLLDMENKLKSGEDLSDAEVSLLYSTMLGQDVAHNTETPHGYNAAQITVEMFPFMAQMMLNPASGLSRALVRKFGKSGVKKIAMTIAGDVAESTVLANTLQAPKTVADAIERYQGEATEGYDENGNRVVSFDGSHNWGSAIGKAEGAAVIENYTEMLGEHFGAIKDFAGKWIGKGVGKLGGSKIVDAVTDLTTKVKTSDWGKAIGNLESRAHWNGTVGEVLEEEAGIVLNSMFTGDNKFSDLVDADQQIDIVLGVGLFGGFVSGVKTIGYPISRARAKSGLRKADGVGGWRFADAWDGIRSEIDNAEESELAETVRNLVSTHAKSEEQMRTIVDYARALMKARGMDLAVAQATSEGNVTPEQQDAEESYAHGEGIAESGDPDAMRDVRTNLDRQRARLVAATSEEFVAEHFDSGNALDNLTAIDLDDDLRGIALDYVNAQHVYDGMIQGVRDDIDSRIAKSDAEIDGKTNRKTGLIQPATMKVDDRQVYVVSGNVTLFDDGSGVDASRSDNSIIVRDAETGKLEFASPSQILKLGETLDAEQEKLAEAERIRQEAAQEASDAIDGRHTFNGGEMYHIIFNKEGDEQMVSVLGPAYDEEGVPLADTVTVQMEDGSTQNIPLATLESWLADTERIRAERFDEEREEERADREESIANGEEGSAENEGRGTDYSRGLDFGIAHAEALSAEHLDKEIEKLGDREDRLTDFGRGMLEGMKSAREAMQGIPDASGTEPITTENDISASGNESDIPESIENVQKTALERIAKDEQGTPLFESADPETAWDALVEDSEDETEAEEYATGMTKVLEKEAEKARKKVGNVKVTGDRAKYKADKEAARKELEEAEKRLAHWQAMLETKNRRQQDAQAAAEAEERRKAAERAERERLERERRDAEARAEAERLRREKEERDGIPEMSHDTPEDARLRGKRRIGTTVYARQEPIAEKVEGKEVTVDFNEKKDGHRPKGKLVVIEAAQGQASHMEGKRNPLFFIDEAQPKDRTDAESILAEQKHAREMDPSLITDSRDMVDPFRGAPTVNMRGEAIQGNHRMAALRYMYANEPESSERYRQYLLQHASEFGLTEEQAQQIASMKEPVLVNMVDVDDAMAIELGQDTGNSRETGGKDRIDADRLANGIGDKMGRFMDTLLTDDSEEGGSLRSMIRRNGLNALKYLRDMGKIDDRQYATAINKDGNLSDEGVEDVEKFIKRSFFAGESREFEEMFDTLPAKAQSAVLAQIWRDSKTAEADKAAPHVKEAVRAFYAMQGIPQFKEARNFKEALQAAEMWRAQTEFNDDGDIVSNRNRHSNFAIRLAAMMKGSSMKETRAVLKQMLDWMQDSGEQAGLFDMEESGEQGAESVEDRTFRAAVKKVFDMEYKPGVASPVMANSGTNEGEGALNNKQDNDKTDTGNENGENGGSDVAGDDQAGTSGKRGGRGNDRGGKRTSGGERTSEPGDGTGPVESSDTSDSRPQHSEDADGGNLFHYFGGTIGELIKRAKSGATGLIKKIISPVSARLQDDLREKGLEVGNDYNHVLDNNAIRHTLKQHGSKKEEKRGQIPVTDEDFSKIEDIVEAYDEIRVEDGKTGAPRIIYSKSYPDGTTIFVEEQRKGRKELAAVTMWKQKKTALTDAKSDDAPQISDLSGRKSLEDKQAEGGKSSERELTAEDLDGIDPDASGIDESVIDGARDYLEGERTPWSEMCYNIAKDYVRNTRDDSGTSGRSEGAGDGELSGPDAEPAGRGTGQERSGSVGVDREDGGDDVSGSGESGEDGARSGGALPGEERTEGTEGENADADAGHTDTGKRGRGRRAGGRGSDVRKSGGKRSGKGDARADGRRNAEAVEGEETAQGMIDDALATLKDIFKNPGMSRPGQLNDVTTLLAGLGVNAARFLGATAKLGCGLVMKGYYKYARWRGEMHRNLDPLLMAHTDLTDEQTDEFIRSAWDMKMSYRGERKKISEWAAELEQEELRRLAQMGIAEKRKLQAEAEGTDVQICDIDNIRETLPFLLPAQHEDVEKAERQFFKAEHADREHGFGKGYLFTNGTGTGKTYTGLGIAKRFLKQGKGRILIVTVNDTKISDWIKDAKNLGIEATQLPDTRSKGKGVVVTQYANLRQNYALLEDQFDLIIYDESHKLMENQEGVAGTTADMHHMIAARDAEAVIMRKLQTSELGRNLREAREEIKRLNEILNIVNKPASLVSDKERDLVRNSGYRSENEVLEALKLTGAREETLNKEMEDAVASAMADETRRAEAEEISRKTKTVFLSATPFNTPSSLDYAEGYIFSYPEEKEGTERKQRRNDFLRKNFGKSHRRNSRGDMTRMSEGQISDPEAVEEEEINFSNYLQDKLHTMSGRMLDSAFDYSRSFPRFDMPEARLVNSAMSEITRGPLSKYFKRSLLDYNYSTAFWEIIKTGFALPRIKEHMALGRKVVVFHRRKASNQDVYCPFATGIREAMQSASEGDKAAAREFALKYRDLLAWESNLDYTYPQDRILNEFVTDEERAEYEKQMEAWRKKRDAAVSAGKRVPPEPKLKSKRVGIFNGDRSAGEKQGAVDNFNLGDQDVIVVQVQSGKEGISLHDTDGKHQRVMMSLALPQSPIEFIQAEGRIYRVGNRSDAIFEYPLLGIDRELYDFAMKINGRSQTSENLAMGAQSRGLRDSITRGALGSTQIPVADGQGKGGKMLDSRQTQKATGFDHAMSNWKEWQEKEAGLPYDERSIPDPIGFKLMEWAGAERGETVLVGYAGEGSAARYAPSSTKLIALESDSGKLARLAALLGGGGRKILGDDFMSDSSDPSDSYSIVNKADVVIVKTKSGTYKDGFTKKSRSVRDIRKALQHTEDSGRIVAIVPTADLKGVGGIFRMIEEQRRLEGCVARTVINLPADVFGEESSIIVIDKNQEPSIAEAKAAQGIKIKDARAGETIEQTLADLRDEEVAKREVDRIAKAVKRVKRVIGAFQDSKLVSTERWRGRSQKAVGVTRYGANVRFTKHIIPESADNLYRCWNGIGIDFSKTGERSYLEEIANHWAGCRKLSEMSLEEFKETYEAKFRTDAQYQEAQDLMGHVCTLIEAATGKTATQLSNIAEGKVENEIKQDMNLSEFKDVYKSLDSGSEELDALAERVFAVAGQIEGLTFKVADGSVFSGHNVMAHYAPAKNAIELNADVFNSIRISDMQKAQCILHETIHAVTCWALSQYKNTSEAERKAMGALADACKDIEEVFKAINNDSFRADLQAKSRLGDNAMYGLSDEYEMLAEMANPAFRRALKGKRLWRQLVNGIKKLFGIDVTDTGEGTTTAFDVLNNAINMILDNFDSAVYADFQARPVLSVHEMRNLFDEEDSAGPAVRQRSLFDETPSAAASAQSERTTKKIPGKWVQTSLFDETPTASASAQSESPAEAGPSKKEKAREEDANRAIDEYAERFAEIYGQYQAFIDAKAEIADELADRLEGELQMIGAMLEGELGRYYLSEGNSEEDAARMARDKAGLVRAEITFALNKEAWMKGGESTGTSDSRLQHSGEAKGKETQAEPKAPTPGQTKTRKSGSYRSAAGEVLEWQSAGERLRRLKDGEFAALERQFAEDGMFPFLRGAGKIETDADVAYLFRCLENSAIENAFAVLVKDGKPLIVHIGMGTSNMTIADTTAIRAAMDAYGTDKVYFVHNHPSGNLRESVQDRNLYARIADMAGEKAAGAVIIDVTSGKYSIFDTNSSAETKEHGAESVKGTVEHGVLSFSRQAFAKDFDPEGLTQIKGSSDVAQFVATRRLGEGSKTGYLLLSRSNKVVGNFYTSHGELTDPEALANEIASQCAAHGAEGAILYGNVRMDANKLARLRGELDRASGKGVRLLDAMKMNNGLSSGYLSATDQGIMEPSAEYGEDKGLLFRMREKEPPKKTQRVYKLMRFEQGRLYPLFIDSAAPTELGVWYDADSPNLEMLRGLPAGTYLINQETGEAKTREDWNAEHPELASDTKYPKKGAIDFATANGLRWIQIEETAKGQRRFGGEARKYWNLGVNGTGSVSTFSMRPGWHAGSLPTMRQIGKGKNKDLRDDRFVWVEGEVSADRDYNAEAERNPDKDLPDRIPEDGYYMKATNADKAKSQADRVGWYVAGSFRANRIISDAEAREIIDAHNAEHPDAQVEYDYRRESGLDFTPTAGMNQGAIYTREGDGPYSDEEVSWLDDPWSRAAGKSLHSARQRKAHAERMRKAMREKVRKLTELYGIGVEIIEDASSLRSDHNGERKRRAKGWFDPRTGKIVIVLGNHSSTADVQATLLHEVVGHKGLRELFGDRFEAFLDAVWANAENHVKERISLLASRNGWYRRTATEEYLASLAEDASFADVRSNWWQKLKGLFMDFLRSCGFSANVRISDNELRYVLWMSWQNLKNPGAYRGFLGEAERVAKEYELKTGEYAEVSDSRPQHSDEAAESEPLFRDGDFTPRDRKIARNVYEGMLAQGSWQFREATQDSMLGLRSLYEAVLTQGDPKKRRAFRIENVAAHENAYLYENRMSSANNAEQHAYFTQYMEPLLKSVNAICGKDEDERRSLTDYMMAKHGLERNDYMRNEAIANGEKADRDFAGLCGLTGEKDWKDAETEAQKMVDDYEADHDMSLINQVWSDTKRATTATLEKIYLSGLISEDTYQKTLGMYDHYIPLRGWEETTSDEMYAYINGHDPANGSVWKHAEGRESKADDPIATIAKMGDDAIRQGNRNIMKQRMLNFVHGNPSDAVSVSQLWLQYNTTKDEWEPVFADLEPDMTAAEIENELKLFEEKMEGLAAAEPDKYKRGRDARNIPYKVVHGNLDEHQMLVKRNGHTYVMTINGNPRAAQALNGLTNPDTRMGGVYGKMIKGASYVNRQLSAFYTTRNPDFVMSNFLRDALYSNCMTWVKENPRYALLFHRNFGRVNPAVMARLLHKWEKGTLSDSNSTEKAFREFMLGGGETGYTNLRDIEQHKKAIAKEMKKMSGRGPKSWGPKAWRWLTEKLDLLNRSVENTARFAAFLTSRQMGRSLDRSIYDAKEISVNFNKKGAGDRFVDAKGQTKLGKTGGYIGGAGRSLYVFWNAGVQGMTNFGRAAKRNPKKGMAGAAALFTLGATIPLLAQMLSGDGDDDDKNAYYNLPEYIRRSNICFKAGEHWVTIPLPIEYRAIYGLGELATGTISGNEHYSDAELAYYMAAQVSQVLPLDFLEGANPTSHDGLNWKSISHPFIPSAVKPFTEAYIMNRGWTGMPVSKETPFNELDPEFKRVYQSTDQHLAEFSRWLNNTTGGNDYRKGAIDINPAKIEYLLNGTFGGMFSFPMKLKKTGETIFGDRDFEWRNIPLGNRVVKTGDERTENRKLQNEYYKYRSEAERTEHEFRGFQKEGARGILESARRADMMYNSEEFLRWQIADAYEPTLAALRKGAQEAPEKEKKEYRQEYYARMRELVNALHNPSGFLKERADAASAQ